MENILIDLVKEAFFSVIVGFLASLLERAFQWILFIVRKRNNEPPEYYEEKEFDFRPNIKLIIVVSVLLAFIFFVRSIYLTLISYGIVSYLAIGGAIWSVLGVILAILLVLIVNTSGRSQSFWTSILSLLVGFMSASTFALPIGLGAFLYLFAHWNIGSIVFSVLALFVILALLWSLVITSLENRTTN